MECAKKREIMPNRYIRANAIESEAVNALSWQGEVFYRRLLNRVDDFGRFHSNPNILRASIFPLQLEKVSVADVIRLMKECEDNGLLFTYSVDGKGCIVMFRWEQGRAKHSDYPDPPIELIERMKTYVYTNKHMETYVPGSDSDTDTDSDAARARARGLPESLSTPAMQRLWPNWLQHWSETFARGNPMPEQTAHAHLRALVAMGPERACAAIKNAITRGLREPAEPLGGGTSKTTSSRNEPALTIV
jgi:hypothetical protein